MLTEAALTIQLGALGDYKPSSSVNKRAPADDPDEAGRSAIFRINDRVNDGDGGKIDTDINGIPQKEEQELLRRLCPQDREQVEQPGLCSYNPLVLDIKHPAPGGRHGKKAAGAAAKDKDDNKHPDGGKGDKKGIPFLPNFFQIWQLNIKGVTLKTRREVDYGYRCMVVDMNLDFNLLPS